MSLKTSVIRGVMSFVIVFDCLDVQLYEEVTKMPPMERKVIVLVGEFFLVGFLLNLSIELPVLLGASQ